jgi:hypothetical protein
MGSAEAIAFAQAQLGKPYVFGATGPDSYDCSGLVQAAWRAGGVSLPRTTYEQVLVGMGVTRDELAPGDLVFPDAGHVQLYVGNDQIIESPHSGAFVRLTNMWGFWRARRVGPQTESNGVSTVGSVVPASLIDQVPVLGTLNTAAQKLTDPVFWKFFGWGALAVLIIGVSLAFIMRRQISTSAKVLGKAAIAA